MNTAYLLLDTSQLLPAREQMAFTLMVHVILVPLGVALPFITLVMNYKGVRRADPVAIQLARRWSSVMAVQFAIGHGLHFGAETYGQRQREPGCLDHLRGHGTLPQITPWDDSIIRI